MERELSRNWWLMALRGVLAILFGVVAFAWPGLWWFAVVITFAAYALADGIMAITAAFTGESGPWWALILEGVVSIAAAVIAVVLPGAAELGLLFVIAGWALATGVLEISTAISLRRYIRGEWALILSGILSVILGLMLALMPIAGLLVVAWWIGAWSIVSGVLMLALAFQLRDLGRHAHTPMSAATP